MVNPLTIFILSLAVGFLLTLIDKAGRKISLTVLLGTLLFNTILSGRWLYGFLYQGTQTQLINTAGFDMPLSINLQFGVTEAFVLTFINGLGFLGALFLWKDFLKSTIYGLMLYLVLLMGVNGLVMTRDFFNMFVFMEIISISTFSLIMFQQNLRSLSAGFKYMMAGGLASSLILIGIIFLYYQSGGLNIDLLIAYPNVLNGITGSLVLFFIIFSIMIELKLYPINGWGLDVYESIHPGISALISSANTGALLFTLYKLLPLVNDQLLYPVIGAGLITFLLSNLAGIKQTNARRLLGYSSIGQIGLLIVVVGLKFILNMNDTWFALVAGGLFVNHLLAKSGLFWLSGIIEKNELSDWKVIKNNRCLMILFGVLLTALAGFPPFLTFWSKWEMVKTLADHNMWLMISMILLGSLFEVAYLYRWFGKAIKGETEESVVSPMSKMLPIALAGAVLFYLSLFIMITYYNFRLIHFVPLASMFFFYLVDFLPAKLKALLSIAIIGAFGYFIYPGLNGIQIVFEIIFIIGSSVQLIATMNRKEASLGYFAFFVSTVLAMADLVISQTWLEFFFHWEIMTIASYYLIIRSKKAEIPAFVYLLFSTAGALLILAGFGYAPMIESSVPLVTKMLETQLPLASIILLTLGFIIKTGSLGVHIWLPKAHAEAESDVSPLISAILLKAGVFGIFLVALSCLNHMPSFNWFYILSWIGVFTALVGSFLAAFQEDAKRLLAYSSMSQLGIILANLAMMSHLGWLSALYLSMNHALFKSILFLAIAGIVFRTKTRNMYEMGGLIKKMPLSYISVLISIIAVSGVPPMSGFGSKWLIFNAYLHKGWYFQGVVLAFSGAVSFLYLYRLIHTIFLGQLKIEHQKIKEAPIWFILPQYLFLGVMMAGSFYPNMAIGPMNKLVSQYFKSDLIIDGLKISSPYGYWNGLQIMLITIAVFASVFVFLYLIIGRMQKVKQFNIVYAAERPDKPETTHYAYNMFAPYKKALGSWGNPNIEIFWEKVSEWTRSLSDLFRSVYTGNGQTYLLQIFIYMIVFLFIIGV